MIRSCCLLLLYVCFWGHAASGHSIRVQEPLHNRLDSLKKADNLAEWIYARVDFCYENPRQTLPFLAATRKALWRRPATVLEKEAWVILLSNLGYNQLYSGDILASIGSYEKAYQYVLSNRLATDITDYVLKPWANNYTRLGDYEKALFIQRKTLDFALKEGNRLLAASVYNNMAISYRSMGNFEEAEQVVKLGLRSCGLDTNLLVLLNNTLADIYKDRGQLDLAERVISKNIARQHGRRTDFDSAYWLLSSYTTAGDVGFLRGRYQEALKYYRLSLGINEKYYKGNRQRERAYLITQMGRLKLAEKKPLEALAYFDNNLKAFGLLDTAGTIREDLLFGDNRIIEVCYERAMAYLALGREEDGLMNVRLALKAADKIRFELADVATRQRFQAETKEKAEKAIGIAFNLLRKSGSQRYALFIAEIAEQNKARTLLDEIRRNQQQVNLQQKDTLYSERQILERAIVYQEKELLQNPADRKSLEAKKAALKFRLESVDVLLREKYPAGPAAFSDGLPVGDVLKKLPRGLQFLEYFVGLENSYAILIQGGRVVHVHQIGQAGKMRKMLADFSDTYYRRGPGAMMDNPKQFFGAAHELYNLLTGSLKFAGGSLCIVPDEEIGYLSFDGLITDSAYVPSIAKWPFFTRKATLSYAFSLQTLLNQSLPKISGNDFTGLFISHRGKERQLLASVEKEAESIRATVSGNFLMDRQATAAHFFEAFGRSAVLHVGTHAYLSGDQREPTLVLDDERVFLFELSARKNTPALVILSACQTADGIMASGEGIISLSRGFAAIGTQGTIAGLWNVNDEAAAVITKDCYLGLLASERVSGALHRAKLNWLAADHSSALEYLPYYWDALVYTGYDQKIALEPASVKGYGMIIWPAAAACAVLLVIWLVLKLKRPKAGYPGL